MLLSAEEPSEPLMAFLGKKAAVITRAIFDVSSFTHCAKQGAEL